MLPYLNTICEKNMDWQMIYTKTKTMVTCKIKNRQDSRAESLLTFQLVMYIQVISNMNMSGADKTTPIIAQVGEKTQLSLPMGIWSFTVETSHESLGWTQMIELR